MLKDTIQRFLDLKPNTLPLSHLDPPMIVQVVHLLLRHNAGQEGRGEILLENSFLR